MKKISLSLIMVLVMAMTGCGTGSIESEDTTVSISEETSLAEVTEVATTEPVTEAETTTEAPVEPLAIKVVAPYGTPALSMIKMMVDNPVIADHVTVTYEAIQATDVVTAELINHTADIAIVPTNLAAVLHAKETGYKIAGSSVWGVLYIVANKDITSIEDLKGESIGMIGRGLTPDAMMRYILTENNVNPETDLSLEYFAGSSELAANFISGQIDVAMIPQPLLTAVLMKKEGAKVVLDLQEAWGDITGEAKYPLSSIIVSEELINNHPEVVDSFLAEFEGAVAWLNENPDVAGTYYESLNLGLTAPIIQKAIPTSNLDYVSASDNREAFDNYLTVLYEFNNKLTGGQPVDEALYFEK